MTKHFFPIKWCGLIILVLGIVMLNQASAALPLSRSEQKTRMMMQQHVVNQVLPITPGQVRALKQKEAAINQAIQSKPISEQQLRSTVRTIDLTDSAPPPLLRAVSGFTTTISFIGSNGSPWPIISGVTGGSAVSIIQPTKEDASNASIVVKQPWVSTNISFYLKGRVRPVTLYVYTAGDPSRGLDGNVTLKVAGIAPGTQSAPVKNISAVSNALLNAVHHAPGSEWKAVALANSALPVSLHYWILPHHHRAIVRVSGGTLVMPEWGAQASNQDHTTTVYEFKTIPLMLWVSSSDGQSFQLRVDDPTSLIAGNTAHLNIQSFPSKAGHAATEIRSQYVK